MRCVDGFAPTFTIRLAPFSSKWLKSVIVNNLQQSLRAGYGGRHKKLQNIQGTAEITQSQPRNGKKNGSGIKNSRADGDQIPFNGTSGGTRQRILRENKRGEDAGPGTRRPVTDSFGHPCIYLKMIRRRGHLRRFISISAKSY